MSGLSNTEIVRRLGLCARTVERRVSTIDMKIGVHHRVEATGWALRRQLG